MAAATAASQQLLGLGGPMVHSAQGQNIPPGKPLTSTSEPSHRVRSGGKSNRARPILAHFDYELLGEGLLTRLQASFQMCLRV